MNTRPLLLLVMFTLLSGCGLFPSEDTGEIYSVQSASADKTGEPVFSGTVSPEVRSLLVRARALWTDTGECTDPERAVSLLDEAIKSDPLDTAALLLRSRALSDQGYLEEAFQDATRAILLSPTAEAYATRGLICLKMHQSGGAERDFSYAEKLNPGEPLIYVYRAAGAFLEERNSDACIDLKKACAAGFCRPWENARDSGVCR